MDILGVNSEMEIEIEFINIGDRIRQNIGDLQLLKGSIKKIGLVHPIVVDKRYQLLSGYRRLQAVKELGWKKVPIKILSLSSELSSKEWEIEENLCRKDFSDQELEKVEKILESIRKRSKLFQIFKLVFYFPIYLFQRIFQRYLPK